MNQAAAAALSKICAVRTTCRYTAHVEERLAIRILVLKKGKILKFVVLLKNLKKVVSFVMCHEQKLKKGVCAKKN